MTKVPTEYWEGYADALLYVQAAYDNPKAPVKMQTITTHLPDGVFIFTNRERGEGDWVKTPDAYEQVAEAIKRLDDAGIMAVRKKTGPYGSVYIEVAGTEGNWGLPKWADPDGEDHDVEVTK